MNDEVRFIAVSLRSECSSCGQPLPINTLTDRARCRWCDAELRFTPRWWADLLGIADDRDEWPRKSQLSYSSSGHGTRQTAELEPRPLECDRCKSPLDDSVVADGSKGELTCSSCGALTKSFPISAGLRELVPSARQVFVADRGPDRPKQTGPVVMSCPSCGGSLQIPADAKRLTACQYCSSNVVLPDAVWQALHPVEPMRPWFIRFRGETAAQAQARAEAEEQRREAAREREEEEQRRRESEQREREQAELEAKQAAENRKWTIVAGIATLLLAAAGLVWNVMFGG